MYLYQAVFEVSFVSGISAKENMKDRSLTFIDPTSVTEKSCPDAKKSCHDYTFQFKILRDAPQIVPRFIEIVARFLTR